jgi:hypothetical protein
MSADSDMSPPRFISRRGARIPDDVAIFSRSRPGGADAHRARAELAQVEPDGAR